MGKADTSVDQGGGGCSDLGSDILGGGSVGNVVWVRDVGDDAAHQEGVERIPPQGGLQADMTTTSERAGRWMDVSPAGGSDGGGGITVGGYLSLPQPEHSLTVHCNQFHYGPMSGGG